MLGALGSPLRFVFVDRYNFVLLAECCCLLCIGLDELEFLKRSCEGFEIVSVGLALSPLMALLSTIF